MKKYILVIFLLVFICSCGFSQKTLRFSYFENGEKKKCQLKLLTGVEKIKKIQSDDGFSEVRALMKDSSILYLTDNYESGSGISDAKIRSYDENIFLRIVTMEKVDIGGIYKGLYWRETKCNKIVCGYYNMPEEFKEQYDDIIKGFITKHCK